MVNVIVSSAGTSGPRGNSVLNGVGAPTGATGIDGDFYIDTAANNLYGPKTGGAWPGSSVHIGAAGALIAANNLSDLGSTATARTNLGLGGAATLNLGTSAGTVAAGNDSRITGAIQSGATAGGDLSGTLPNPTVAKVNGVTVTGTPTAGQVPTATSGTAATWQTPAAVPNASGTVTSETSYGQASAAGTAGTFSRGDHTHGTPTLPAASTSVAGVVQLDGTAADIAPLGTQAAGAVGKAADAGHVHAMPRLDQVQAPAAAVPMNSQKITGLANGSAATDAAAFGQIPTTATTSTAGTVQLAGDLAGTATSPQVTGTHLAAPLPIAQGGTGASSAGGAITSLGLGGAATLNVGTTTGTVAAGDDARITGAIQSASIPQTGAVYSPSRRLPKWPQPSNILTEFQSGHGYSNNAGSTFTANDTTDFIVGTQACKIVTGGAGAAANVSKLAGSTFDTTSKVVRLRLKIDDITHVAGLNLYLGSGGLTSYYKWIIQGGAAGSNFVISGQWLVVTLNWHDATTTGTPARNSLTDVRLQVTDDNTGNQVTAHYQSVELIPDASSVFPTGVISICFDDCWQSVRDLGTILDTYGYPAGIYTIHDMVGQSGRLSLAELYSLQDQLGWEIASHANTDADHSLTYTGLTASALDADLLNLKAWATLQGFRGGDGTAYPLGQYGLTTDGTYTTNIVRRYFNYARTTNSKTKETFPPADPYRLRAISSISTFSGGYAPSNLTTATTGDLDLCKTNQTWLILVFHKITTGTVGDTSTIAQSDFNTIISHINANGTPVLPIGDVLKYYG